MQKYYDIVITLAKSFQDFHIKQIAREENQIADVLANLGSSLSGPKTRAIPIIRLSEPAISRIDGNILSHAHILDWRTLIKTYLETSILPLDRNESRRIKVRATRFCLVASELYKRSLSRPLLKCLGA